MTREQLYAFNRMCNEILKILEVDRQWLPLIRKTLWNWLNFLGQHQFFSKLENSIITDAARREVELLIVPVNPNMQINELLARTMIPNIIFWGLVINDNLINAAEQFKATRRNYRTFYNSWVYLTWQARIVEKYYGLIHEHIPYGTVQYLTLGATETGELAFNQKLQEQFAKQTSWMSLPEHTRLDKIGDSTQDWLFKLMQLPRIERYEKSCLTELNVRRDLEDEYRRLTKTEKGRIKAETTSLDEEVEIEDGDNIPMFELIPAPTQQIEIEEDFTPEQREKLKEVLGKIGLRIFEYRYRHQEIIGRGEQKELAKVLGYAESTVSKYIRIIEENVDAIRNILA